MLTVFLFLYGYETASFYSSQAVWLFKSIQIRIKKKQKALGGII